MTIIFPLEKILQKSSEDHDLKMTFPDHKRNYYQDYASTLAELRRVIYPHINVALAVKSEDVGVYTDHGGEHFDEVVKYAGMLLGLKREDANSDVSVIDVMQKTGSSWHLSAYEVFLLLHAIRFHDTGNFYGREDHEKKIPMIMKEIQHFGLTDLPENRIISIIGGAHGGKISETDKDTIGKLSMKDTHGGGVYRPQLIAAVVRIADELCEGRKRASSLTVPKGNEIYHEYAKSIVQCNVVDATLDIRFELEKNDSITLYGKDGGTTYITNEILKRLDKMELERRYCNMFLLPELQIRKFVAKITIWEDVEEQDGIIEHKVVRNWELEVSEAGYPGGDQTLLDIYSDIDGAYLKQAFGNN